MKRAYFEQVPIEVPEAILRRDAELPHVVEKSHASKLAPVPQPAAGIPEEDEVNAAKGQL